MKTIIEMARDAGFETMLRKGRILGVDRDGDYTEEIKDFAELVRAEGREAIRVLTEQCANLIRERDELQKQVWVYEKNGVTCQTYRHKVDASCSECNVQEKYSS